MTAPSGVESVLESVRRGRTCRCHQLAHAGRNASCAGRGKAERRFPRCGEWLADRGTQRHSLCPDDNPLSNWTSQGLPHPEAFADAARRAGRLDIDAVQIHARMAICSTSFFADFQPARRRIRRQPRQPDALPDRSVRCRARSVPADRPVTVRVSGTDWVEGGWTAEETALLQGAGAARLFGNPRLRRRPRPAPANPCRSRLSSAAGEDGQGRGRHTCRGGRNDHRSAAGGRI